MKDKIISVIARHGELEQLMTEQAVLSNSDKLKEVAREHRHLSPIVLEGDKYLALIEQINDDLEILKGSDEELKSIAQAELKTLQENKKDSEEALKVMLIPKDPNDDKNTIIEIRAGTGGDEAGLFVADLYRMYERFSERNQWTKEAIGISETGIGGFKEVTFSLKGEGCYGLMKFEGGVHRVQRIPKTETSGRVHTSAATVAVLPEAEEVDIEVLDQDLKIDTYRASGAGGQHVNKTESAIRITHLPTGLVVTCQDEKSQHKNKAAALKVLRARLLAAEQERQAKERAVERKSMVSTGDRSAKIRTYNFPQGRITDHRINYTSYRLEENLDGDLFEMIESLQLAEQQSLLDSE
ncbi:MAG: peptide chain release factor 1 [Candidatus Marinimicrobia bacterium]|jgi:peptide chain release factor 1|nr:peptide chain release factor 1 [Candidatus Neomarinimicrobiota bacterium]MBT3617720.1 peptide chain release factor 1 [Candidatus Neomarinimicrobiota bacterium]MBT3828405.1 peptide chain release factor 1 [Candidatus Neomarinimicrobiota bacterium]MBT3997541.1 peptide chain release factor 1 [Candidatus Neomarinimicrobiota bacterium]MBT4280702.1 peptide chain release factor 1 [Candidatus Neomarinimicrobiota bacterium]